MVGSIFLGTKNPRDVSDIELSYLISIISLQYSSSFTFQQIVTDRCILKEPGVSACHKKMPFTLYDVTVPIFIRQLKMVSSLLKRGVDYSSTAAIPEEKLLMARLIADMEPLTFQIRVNPTI